MPSRLWPRLAVSGVSLVVALGIAEIASRTLLPEPVNMRWRVWVERAEQRGHHEMVNDVLQNDPVRFWRLRPSLTLPEDNFLFPGVVSNARGLREAREIPPERPDDEIRVLFVGDSCTFGLGLKQQHSLVGFVEEFLRQRFPGVPIECINAGVPGYSLFQGWLFLETEGYAYEPDLVVINYGTNDWVRWNDQSDFEHYRAWLAAQPPRWLAWSRLTREVWQRAGLGRWVGPGSAAPVPPEVKALTATPLTQPETGGEQRRRLSPQEFESLIDRIQTDTRAREMELLLIEWPYSWNVFEPLDERTALQLVIEHYGEERLRFGPQRAPGHVDLVRLAQAIAEKHPPKAIFADTLHTTAAATRLFGELIAQRLTPWVEAEIAARGLRSGGAAKTEQR